MRVLIVDDSRAMRMIVKRGLRQAGLASLDVDEAGNGVEALESMARATPDVVLSDWNMPEMDGLTFLQRCRGRGYTGRFGFVTSTATADLRAAAEAHGAHFVLSKPFTPDQLGEALRLGHKAALQGSSQQRDLSPRRIQDLLGQMLNKRVTASKVAPLRVRRGTELAAATFANGDGALMAVAVAEPAIALGAAAALSMMPASSVRGLKSAPAGQLADNLREVFNLFARVLSCDVHAVRLDRVAFGSIPPDAARLIARSRERADLIVEVAGYGSGRLSLLLERRDA